VEAHALPFNKPLSDDDLQDNLKESHRWVQRTVNIQTLDKVQEILRLFPDISYSTYRRLSDLLRINSLSNFVIRLLISTQHKILPKIFIDTLEYDFAMRRMTGRGYTKYFKNMDIDRLMQLLIEEQELLQLMPEFSRTGTEKEYFKSILTIMIKEEIKHKQEIMYLKYGTIPQAIYGSVSKIQIERYMDGNHETDAKAQKHYNLSLSSKKWQLSNDYLFNINDIRTSIRLQKKRELREERKLEEIRERELLVSQQKDKLRTRRYNKKARKNLSYGTKTAVLHSEDLEKDLQNLVTEFKNQVSNIISVDDNIAINIESDKATVSMDDSQLQLHIPLQPTSSLLPTIQEEEHSDQLNQPLHSSTSIDKTRTPRRKKRPKMIIVDKTHRRPPSRLVGQEYSANRDCELIHETLEGYDYLIQEYFMEPGSDTMYMVLNTYLDGDQYKATVCPIDCELQNIPDLHSHHFKYYNIIGENGIIDLVTQFHNMATANNTWPKTNGEWLEFQKKDEFWSQILLKLNAHDTCIILKQKDNIIDYVTRESLDNSILGPLVRYISVPKQLTHSQLVLQYREEYRQMMVPDNLIMACMEITHRALGHPGFHRMWHTIRKSYFWKSMQNDVRMYCSNCHHCRSRKSSSEKGAIPIEGYYISERPWQRCHIDCMVGLPISDEGQFTAVLILKCALSKFVCLEPLKDVTAHSISEALITIFTNHGVPEYVISDNGVEFANCLTSDVLKLLGARKFHITPLNPRANGQAENQVKTVKDMLSMLIKKDQRDWSMFIKLVQMRYNSTVNQATGFSPYFLMNGREMPMPDHEHIQSTYDNNKNIEIEGYYGNLILAMMLVWEAAGEEILNKTETYNRTIGTNIENDIRQYEPGQYVLTRRIPRRFYKDPQENVKYHINLKLQPIRWTGPYRILQKISPVLYILDFHNTEKKIHIMHLKLASNISINRRRLEIIRKRDRQDSKVTTTNSNNEQIDEIWHNQINENQVN